MFYPTSWTIDHKHNPDKYYKIFESHCPNEPESAFYFATKHQQNPGDNNWTKKSPLGKNEVGSHYWKLLKTVPLAKLVFQSYSIQTYLELPRSAKWVPEREKSRFIQVSIVLTSAKNVVSIQSSSKWPGNKPVPVTSFIHIDEKVPSQIVATECEQLANAYSKELSFRTILSSHKLSTN